MSLALHWTSKQKIASSEKHLNPVRTMLAWAQGMHRKALKHSGKPSRTGSNAFVPKRWCRATVQRKVELKIIAVAVSTRLRI